MARALNKVQLIGNLGGDPEIRTTGSGTKLAKFSIATNRQWKDGNGQQQEKTEWHRCTIFGRLADVVEQYVSKGDRLYVEGRLEYSQTQDENGATRYWTDIVVHEMLMLGGTGASNGASQGSSAPRASSAPSAPSAPSGGFTPPSDDSLPF